MGKQGWWRGGGLGAHRSLQACSPQPRLASLSTLSPEASPQDPHEPGTPTHLPPPVSEPWVLPGSTQATVPDWTRLMVPQAPRSFLPSLQMDYSTPQLPSPQTHHILPSPACKLTSSPGKSWMQLMGGPSPYHPNHHCPPLCPPLCQPSHYHGHRVPALVSHHLASTRTAPLPSRPLSPPGWVSPTKKQICSIIPI